MFHQLATQSPDGNAKGARFLHLLGTASAPPAMVADSRITGLPQIGCCAVIDSMEHLPDGTLLVSYHGDRRVSLLYLLEGKDGVTQSATAPMAAAEWFDDQDVGEVDPSAGAAIDAAEQDLSGVVRYLQKLSLQVDPEHSALPEAVVKYAPPPKGAARKTSYDALKASGHRAATAIEVWRRHGSVYSTQRAPKEIYSDPYTAMAESLGKSRRQELFSFAAAQLLQIGTPERAALLLSQDTAGRLQFVLEAVRPYLAELAAKASVQGALRQR